MSRFSAYLKELVEESGVSHASLARAAGLNRPNFQNILNGSRKPSRKDVNSLLPHLRVNAAQQAKLLELLEGELLGEDIVERRAYVRAMLEQLDQVFQATPLSRQVWPAVPVSTKDTELISGDAAILNMLAALLAESNRLGGRMVIFPGFPKNWLQKCLSILCGLDGEKLQIAQLVKFWKAPQSEAAAANLNALSDALPMLLSSRLDYGLWYTYTAHVELPHAGVLFPCCLLLPQAVFLLHRDSQQAMILRGPEFVRCWQEGAQAMLAGAKPLFNRNLDTLNILNYYNGVDTRPHRFGFLEFQPCLVRRRRNPGQADPARGARARRTDSGYPDLWGTAATAVLHRDFLRGRPAALRRNWFYLRPSPERLHSRPAGHSKDGARTAVSGLRRQ